MRNYSHSLPRLKELILKGDVTYSIDSYSPRTLSHLTQYSVFAEGFRDVALVLVIYLHHLEPRHFFFSRSPLIASVRVRACMYVCKCIGIAAAYKNITRTYVNLLFIADEL